MLFTSIEYLVFLPIIMVLFFCLKHRSRWALLLLASYFFYSYWRFDFLLIVLASTLIDYWAGLRMGRHKEKRKRKPFLYFSLFANLGLLFAFKYLGFFNEELRSLFQFFDVRFPTPEFDILLPSGISFYTFQTLSYSLDVYKGIRKPERHLGYFALYVSFFPQLVAGPIERSTTLLPQLRNKQKFSWINVSVGFRLILWGLFKKVIVADYLYMLIVPVMRNPELYSGGIFIVGMFATALWIYADFSGYTDIAIGSARLFGIKLLPNFRRPYLSSSISELWQRWHMSLTTWINQYFFKPLIRRSNSWFWRYFSILLIFTSIGFWHGASWNFVAFGLLHGVYIILNRISKSFRRKLVNRFLTKTSLLRKAVNVVVTLLFWTFSSIFFIADDLHESWYIITHLAEWKGLSALMDIPGIYTVHLVIIIIGSGMFITSEIMNKKELENPWDNVKYTVIRWCTYMLMIFMLISFSHQVSNEFFYFQF
jgi:alginate O-acetyltransferase complex protein AlgI